MKRSNGETVGEDVGQQGWFVLSGAKDVYALMRVIQWTEEIDDVRKRVILSTSLLR